MLYNRRVMERQLAQLDTIDAGRSGQIARGEITGQESLSQLVEVKPGVFKTWDDAIAFKRKQIKFRLTRVGMVMDELRAAQARGDKEAVNAAFRAMRALRICPECEHFPQEYSLDICIRCGASLKSGSSLPPSDEAAEPGDGTGLPLVTQTWRRTTIEEARLRQREPGISIRWRPNGEEIAEILE